MTKKSFSLLTSSTLKIIYLFFLCSLLMPLTESRAEHIDRVVAVVNDDVITFSELNEEGLPFFQKIATEVAAENRDRAFRQAQEEILNGLIDKLLISQEAARQGLVVKDEEIDATIARIAAANNTTPEIFAEKLKEKGIRKSAYRNNIKSQIYQNKLVTRAVSSKVVITEDMILDYFDTEYTSRVAEGGYYLLQIGISWGETGDSRKSTAALYEDKMAAKKTAERVHKLARSGRDFGELARKFSDMPSASDGGDIGVFQQEDMASYMKAAVTSLKPGEISPIIETPVGFQFFKLLSNKDGGIVIQVPYESVKEDIREQLYNKAVQAEFNKWINDIKEKSYIKKLL